MKKLSKGIFALLFAVTVAGLTGCNSEASGNVPLPGSGDNISRTPEDLNTDRTDALKLTKNYEDLDFIDDNIGEVQFRSCTDGDTANFFSHGEKIKLRFLGVNTPESTAQVQPWGVAASSYVCSIISEPTTKIVLENDPSVFDKMDNNGTRYLGFVWYKKANQQDFRLLNLELVDLAYSLNQLFKDSDICPYADIFASAENYARTTGAKVYGEKDPMFDYSKNVYEITIGELRNNYDDYGKTETSSGKQLRIKALVVGMIGDDMVLRDLTRNVDAEEDSKLPGIYAFVGYNTALASFVEVGDIVQFYCRANKFNGTMQLSDVKTSQFGRQPFMVLTDEPLTGPTEEYPQVDLNPYEMDTSSFTAYRQMEEFSGMFIETNVTIRTITPEDVDEDGNPIQGEEIYFKKDDNNNYTCYANSEGHFGSSSNLLTLNLRVDGDSYPYVNETFFKVGRTYHVKGYLSPYFEKYQLMLFNNIEGMDYITDITNE